MVGRPRILERGGVLGREALICGNGGRVSSGIFTVGSLAYAVRYSFRRGNNCWAAKPLILFKASRFYKRVLG
jgi:hypothetical protein